ncbi:hypothetical protein ACH3XW_42395 [Acanthocheilonema viteae]
MDQNPIFPSTTTTTAELQNPATNEGENMALTDNSNLSHGVYSHIRSQSGSEVIGDAGAKTAKNNDTVELGHIAQQLYIIRRLIFFLFFVIYTISIPICLF